MAHQPEAQFDRNERFSSTLIANLPGMVYRCRNDRDWTMEFVSKQCLELTGYAPQDLIGNREISYNELIHSQDRQRVWERVQRALETKRRFQMTYRIVTRSGEEKWVWEQGSVIRSAEGEVLALEGYIFDMTQQRQAEETEREYDDLVKHIQIGLVVYKLEDINSDRTLRLTAINPAACALMGLSAEAILNKLIDEIFPLLRDQGIPQLFAKVVRSGKPKELEQFNYGDERVEEAVWAFKAFPLPDHRVAVTFEDITDRKRLEEQFLQAQKMEVVGRLAGGVAHDFNNILTGIGGFSQLLLKNVESDSEASRDLLEIHALVDRAESLTRQLLAFSRQQTVERVVFNLNETIESSTKMLQRLTGEDVQLKFVGEPELGNVKGDPGKIEQVLMNLVVNARDAMPTGGKLTIETTNASLSEDYASEHFQAQSGSYVMLSVSDQGCGMDQETRKKIFEPFFTTKEKGKGTGLGLSTVYGIVKQHAGYIWVYSELDKGTTFKVYLPRVDEQAKEPMGGEKRNLLPEGSETVLLAEDETSVRKLVERILTGLGYEVLSAEDPQAAEEIFESRSNDIDILLTDVVMPGGTGPELYKRLSSKVPSLKVLYMSGYTSTEMLPESLVVQEASYMQKPFRPAELAGKLREILDSKQRH